jgi:hypothetical protein
MSDGPQRIYEPTNCVDGSQVRVIAGSSSEAVVKAHLIEVSKIGEVVDSRRIASVERPGFSICGKWMVVRGWNV